MSKPKLTVIVTIVMIAALFVAYRVGHNTLHAPVPDTRPTIEGLWLATNANRVSNSLPALELDANLTASATARCTEMAQKHYYNHVSPTGVTPQDVISKYTGVDITRYYSGENIADGTYTSQSVTNAWMASSEHKANILNSHYRYVGYAVCANATDMYVVQDFLSDQQ